MSVDNICLIGLKKCSQSLHYLTGSEMICSECVDVGDAESIKVEIWYCNIFLPHVNMYVNMFMYFIF